MSKYRLQLISGSGKLNGMGHNKIMQPEINQPRVFDEHGQSGLKKAGILNLVVDDLPHDMLLELRQNIIRHANEVCHMGTQNNSEYATIIDSKTGEVFDKTYHLITDMDLDMVTIPDEVFCNRTIKSVSIVHNHTNGTIPSNDDVLLLLKNETVNDIYIVTDGRLIKIAKMDKIQYNVDIDNIDKEVNKIVIRDKCIGYVLANGSDKEFAKVAELFGNHGILLERW